MVNKLNLFITPPSFGKLLASNKDELEKLGLFIESKRNSTERLYIAKYQKSLGMIDDKLYRLLKDDNNGS